MPELDTNQAATLDRVQSQLQQAWNFGRNIVLAWAFDARHIEFLALPCHLFAGQLSDGRASSGESREDFIQRILSGPGRSTGESVRAIGRALSLEPCVIDLAPHRVEDFGTDALDAIFRPYSLNYSDDRAVALFDIVGFARYTPLEQVAQLNSLGYSINQAHSQMLSAGADVNFARSTTGDGFYLWNRERSVRSNVTLYLFMHLVLADNAISRAQKPGNAVPYLRACFHIGGHYEYYDSYQLRPTAHSYIVGPVTVELARMAEKARPGQILIGDFRTRFADEHGDVEMTTVSFVERAQAGLDRLHGIALSGAAIESITCYLTGDADHHAGFGIKKYLIRDKHGFSRAAYNAKLNIYRHREAPIFLGAPNSELAQFEQVVEVLTGGGDTQRTRDA